MGVSGLKLELKSKVFRSISFLILIGWLSGCSQQESTEEVGTGFSLLGGGSADLSSEERVVFLNYWAVWCAPCIAEMPELYEFSQEFSDRTVVYAVNWDGVDEAQLALDVGTLNVEIPSIISDPQSELGLPRPEVLPTTYVLRDGELKETLVGPQTLHSLEELLVKWEKTI